MSSRLISVLAASAREYKRGKSWSVLRFAGAAAIAGTLIGGAANATYETKFAYEHVGQYLLDGGKTQDPYDFLWGTGYTALVAAGMAAHDRRSKLKKQPPPPVQEKMDS